MARALIPLTADFEEIEAITIIDVLRRGNVTVVTAALGDSLSVVGAHGITVQADALLADVIQETYDAIILPGGPGTDAFATCEILVERLHRQREEGMLLCAICAAPVVLCNLGLLDAEQQVTCYPSCSVELDRKCVGVPVVEDGNVITGEAPGAAMLFALIVLQRLTDDFKAGKTARALVTDVLEEPPPDGFGL